MASSEKQNTSLFVSLSSQSSQPTLYHQKKQVFYNEQLKRAKLGTAMVEKSSSFQTVAYSRHILTSTKLFSDQDTTYRFLKHKMEENVTLTNISRIANQQQIENPLKGIIQEKKSTDFVNYMRKVADPKVLSTRKSLGTFRSNHSGTLNLSHK